MKNTYKELELSNGEKIKLTLNFARLLYIRNQEPKQYDELMRIMQSKDIDPILDSIKVIYVAYLCANVNNEVLKEEEFMELVPFDLEKVNILAGQLLQGGK